MYYVEADLLTRWLNSPDRETVIGEPSSFGIRRWCT